MRHDDDVRAWTTEDEPQNKVSLLSGFQAFAGGIGFIIITPRVWGYALVPAIMFLLLLCGVIILAIWGSFHFTTSLDGPDVGTWGQIGLWSLRAFLWLVGLVLALLVALSLAQPLSGWALESISHAQEVALTGSAAPKTSFLANLFSTAKAVLMALTIGGSLLTVLFLISFFFPPAAVVTVPLKFIVCGWMLAWDFIDYPLAMRGVGLERRFAWVGRNFGAFTLFGLAWALLVIVPGVVFLILPMGVAGATQLVIADEEAQRARGPSADVVLPA